MVMSLETSMSMSATANDLCQLGQATVRCCSVGRQSGCGGEDISQVLLMLLIS